MQRSVYLNEQLYRGVVRSSVMGYEKYLKNESECSSDEVFEKFGGSVTNG